MTNDEFEALAEQFYNETGYLAPGKDWPAMLGGDPRGDYDVRLAKWTEWKRQQFADGPRPHGTNPAIFNGPCDCDECQLWDLMQREANDA